MILFHNFRKNYIVSEERKHQGATIVEGLIAAKLICVLLSVARRASSPRALSTTTTQLYPWSRGGGHCLFEGSYHMPNYCPPNLHSGPTVFL